MSKHSIAIALLVIALAGPDASLAQAPREVELQRVEMDRARAAMEQARRQLEEAARTIADRVDVPRDLENLSFVLRNNSGWASQAQIGATIVDSERGALVTALTPGGGAETAGVKVGDVIQSVDGVAIADAEPARKLMTALQEVDPGETVALTVERAGQTLNIDVETSDGPVWMTPLITQAQSRYLVFPRQSAPAAPPAPAAPSAPAAAPAPAAAYARVINGLQSLSFAASPWGDMELVAITEGLGRYFDTSDGLLVVQAPGDEAIDIQEGDVILAIGGRTPNSPEHAIRILSSFESGETIEFSIMRDRRPATIEYTIPEPGFPFPAPAAATPAAAAPSAVAPSSAAPSVAAPSPTAPSPTAPSPTAPSPTAPSPTAPSAAAPSAGAPSQVAPAPRQPVPTPD